VQYKGGLHHIVENWGTCNGNCPNENKDHEVPLCPTDNTNDYPANCKERHDKKHKNILFLGNSYTYFWSMPTMVTGIAKAAGFSATTPIVAPGGMSLMGHAEHSLYAIEGGYWDVVVIQGQSQNSAFFPADVGCFSVLY
jgi:hypothetical protein